MYWMPSGPIAVFDVTEKGGWDFVILAIQLASVFVAAVAVVIAVLVPKKIEKDRLEDQRKERERQAEERNQERARQVEEREQERARQAEEREQERERQAALLGAVLKPEASRLLNYLRQAYETMCRMKNLYIEDNIYIAARDRLQWLDGFFQMNMAEKQFDRLHLLPSEHAALYAQIVGLLPSLHAANYQFRVCQADSGWRDIRFAALEFSIGDLAVLLQRILDHKPGDPEIGPLHTAMEAFKTQSERDQRGS